MSRLIEIDLKKWRQLLSVEEKAEQMALIRNELRSFSSSQLERLPKLFVAADQGIAPLAPAIRLRGVKFMAREGLRLANATEHVRRDLAYEYRLRRGYEGPRLIAEGDSWFQYPFLLKDTIDWLGESYAIRNLAAGGDRLSDIIARGQVADAIARENAEVLLLSGGGNDLLIPEVLSNLARIDGRVDEAAFEIKAQAIKQDVQTIIGQAKLANPEVKILMHAYDYALCQPGGRWLDKPLREKGLKEPQINAFVMTIMDRLADIYIKICEETDAYFIDCRRQVGRAEHWHDELHPDSMAYGRIAAQFDQKLKQILGDR